MEPDLELLQRATTAAQRAYAPYSQFRVGAAVRCADGSIFVGANVENRSYGLTVCAERCAVQTAVNAGHTHFVAVAVACPDAHELVAPCGACRQVLSEFMQADAVVHLCYGDSSEPPLCRTLGQLYPMDSLHGLRGEM